MAFGTPSASDLASQTSETDPAAAAEAEALKRGFGTSDADLRAYAGAAGAAAGNAACAALGAPEAGPLCAWVGGKLGGICYDLGKDVVEGIANLLGGNDPCADNPSACTATNALRIPWTDFQTQLASQWISWWVELRQLGVDDPPTSIADLVQPAKGARDWWSTGLAGALAQWPPEPATSDPANHYRQLVQLYSEASAQLSSAALLAAAAHLMDRQGQTLPNPIGFRVVTQSSLDVTKPVVDYSGATANALVTPVTATRSSAPVVTWFRCTFNHAPIIEADARQSTAILQTGLEKILQRKLEVTGLNDAATMQAWADALARGKLDAKSADDVLALCVIVASASPLVQQAQIAGGFLFPGSARAVPQGDWSDLVDGVPSVKAPVLASSTSGGAGFVKVAGGVGLFGLLAWWALPKLIGV